MTEENVIKTVEKAQTALQEFNTKDLAKYVDSSTLSIILKYADGKEQFTKLGQAMFENLTMDVKSVDLEKGTVTVVVKNKELSRPAKEFADNLNSQYNKFQLLMQLDNELFLDGNLSALTNSIAKASMREEGVEVELTVTQGKKNLVLGFDETAEDAVSGGALTAIKKVFV